MFNKKYKDIIKNLEEENSELKTNAKLIERHQALISEIECYSRQIANLKSQIINCSTQIEYQDLNIYEPHFAYNDSEEYKNAIKINLQRQKELIYDKHAVILPDKGTVGLNGNKTQDNSIVVLIYKLILSTFNSCCNETIKNSNPYAYEKYKKFIIKKFDDLNNLTRLLDIYISNEYLNLKIEQLNLENEKNIKIEQEKEEKRQQQEIIKEQRKIEAEINQQKEKLERERKKYELELQKCKNEDTKYLQEKIDAINEQIANDDFRLNNNRAGWLYVISNPDMINGYVKLGVTRRLDPQERIDELGNASHAYKFNVHGMVFSDDVFFLESKIHQYFASQKVNQINQRKEFFKLNIEQVETALNSFGYHIKLDPNPINEQYVLSEKMKGNI